MEAYKKWVRKNKDYLHSLESLTNGLTWLLPERFAESEIGPEAVSAFVGLITVINEHIISTAPPLMPMSSQMPMSSAEPSSSPWSLCVSVIKNLETLVEVAAQHLCGDDNKWDFIAITEATKVLFRLAKFRDSGYKMLLQGGETENVQEDPNPSSLQQGMGGLTKPGGHNAPGFLQNRYGRNLQNLEGRAVTALNRFGETRRMVSDPTWLNRIQDQPSLRLEPPTSVVKRPTLSTIWSEKGLYGGLFLTAEVLHITRPLIYVLFIRKYGVRSWIPWVLSLAIDLTGMGILSHVTHPGRSRKDGDFQLTTLEKNEIKRRKLLWAFYLMRDPFFSKYTRQKLEKTEKFMEPVPVIGFLIVKVMELVIGAQTRYTYMSAS